jgi:hypothetical protein
VTGSLQVASAQLVGVLGAGLKLGLDGERDLECERRDGIQEQLSDCVVDAASGDAQAAPPGVLDALAHALIVRDFDAVAEVVSDGHPPPTASAHDEALEQRGPLARGAGGALLAVRLGVLGEEHVHTPKPKASSIFEARGLIEPARAGQTRRPRRRMWRERERHHDAW